MSLGKPVICSDVAGIKDYVEPGTAVMIPNDVAAWRDALLRLFTDEAFARQIAGQGHELFLSRFSEQAMHERIARVVANSCCYGR